MERGIPQRLAMLAKDLPPVEQWNPPLCGTVDIRIARGGDWYHEGIRIARPELVRLFSTVLRKEADGFYLVTPAEKLKIVVEDAPFEAVLLTVEGTGRDQKLVFTTNVGDETVTGPENVIRVETLGETQEPSPYVHVRRGLEAKIARAVFYQLADLAEPGEDGAMGVWSGGVFFSLGPGA